MLCWKNDEKGKKASWHKACNNKKSKNFLVSEPKYKAPK